MLLPSPAPKPSAGPLCPEGFQQVWVFFLLLLTKVPAGWEISMWQRQPSPMGQILPANLCWEWRLVLGWPLGMLLGGKGEAPIALQATWACGHEQALGIDRVMDGWVDGHHELQGDLMFYHLLVGLCGKSKVLEVHQGLN